MFKRPDDRRRRLLLRGRFANAGRSDGGRSGLGAVDAPLSTRGPAPATSTGSEGVSVPSPRGGGSDGSPYLLLTPGAAPGEFEVELTAGDGPGEILRFDAPVVVIGRAPGCDLRLPDPDVSGRHAVLVAAGGRYLAIDLGGRTGLFVNRRPVPFGWFGLGDELSVGPFRLVCRSDAASAPPPQAASALFSRHPEPPARLTLRLPRPGGRPADVAIDRPVTLVGRSRACKVRLTDRSVSQVHAGLILTRGGLVVIDLLSRQGLVVNGRTTKVASLAAGDHLKIGARWLEIVDGAADAADVAAPPEFPSRPPTAAPESARRLDSPEPGTAPPFPERTIATDEAQRRPPGDMMSPEPVGGRPSRVAALAAALSGDEQGWPPPSLCEAIETLLRLPDETASAELERFGDLSDRLAGLRAGGSGTDAPGVPAASVELLEAEWEHSRRTVLALLSELPFPAELTFPAEPTGRGVAR